MPIQITYLKMKENLIKYLTKTVLWASITNKKLLLEKLKDILPVEDIIITKVNENLDIFEFHFGELNGNPVTVSLRFCWKTNNNTHWLNKII